MKWMKRIVAIVLVVGLLVGLGYVSRWEQFDAKKYVQAVLDANFKGDVTAAVEIIEGQDETELLNHYEAGIESFMDKNVLSGVKTTPVMREKYRSVCKEIFKSMEYEVTQVQTVDRREMYVTVTYRQADIFPEFVEAVKRDSLLFLEGATNGAYKGTKKQIRQKMEKDFIKRSYLLLKECHKNVEYGEPETMLFKVTGDKKNVFSMDEAEISEFIAKILMIDEIGN